MGQEQNIGKRLAQGWKFFHGETIPSSDTIGSENSLAMRGVPNTAYRKTLVGEKVVGKIEKQLFKFGFRPRRVVVRSEFRFGNAGILVSEEPVLLPAKIAGKKIVIKTAILPNEGSETSLQLSKKILRQLVCVINFTSDVIQFHEIGAETPKKKQMIETSTGHYGIRLFNFEKTFNIAADCCAAEHTSHAHTQRGSRDKAYDVSQLEIEVKKKGFRFRRKYRT